MIRIVEIGLPDFENRKAILTHYLKNIKHSKINVEILASKTDGLSAASIKNIINEAAVEAARKMKKKQIKSILTQL